MSTKSVNARLLSFLKTGGNITANQAYTRFGIANMSQRINDLRKAGFAIYCNTKTTANGNTIRAYRLGTPTRQQVAAGYIAQNDSYISYVVRDTLEKNLALAN
jgi:predicted ArsR family transcriptional regulator